MPLATSILSRETSGFSKNWPFLNADWFDVNDDGDFLIANPDGSSTLFSPNRSLTCHMFNTPPRWGAKSDEIWALLEGDNHILPEKISTDNGKLKVRQLPSSKCLGMCYVSQGALFNTPLSGRQGQKAMAFVDDKWEEFPTVPDRGRWIYHFQDGQLQAVGMSPRPIQTPFERWRLKGGRWELFAGEALPFDSEQGASYHLLSMRDQEKVTRITRTGVDFLIKDPKSNCMQKFMPFDASKRSLSRPAKHLMWHTLDGKTWVDEAERSRTMLALSNRGLYAVNDADIIFYSHGKGLDVPSMEF